MESAVVNHAQLVGTPSLVPTYDWADFFDCPFRQRALKGIKAIHHLRFADTNPGYVFVKDNVDSLERTIKLVQDDEWEPEADDLPPVIPPPWSVP